MNSEKLSKLKIEERLAEKSATVILYDEIIPLSNVAVIVAQVKQQHFNSQIWKSILNVLSCK